jgi:hypothetical protein
LAHRARTSSNHSAKSHRMAAKIRDHGGVAEELTYGGVGHLTLIGAFAPGLRVLAPVLHDATQFVGVSHAGGIFGMSAKGQMSERRSGCTSV